MRSFVQIRALVLGIVNTHTATKQELGQRFAEYLGLSPGPLGPDDGVDGLGWQGGRKIHFQCKLRSTDLDKDDARLYYSDLKFHAVQVSVMLAGVGYTEPFRQRLFGHPDIQDIRIHLLTLWDLFGETRSYQDALKDLPRLSCLALLAAAETASQPPEGGKEAQ